MAARLVDAAEIPRDEVPRRRRRAADGHERGIGDGDALVAVAQRGAAGGVGADPVPLDNDIGDAGARKIKAVGAPRRFRA